MALNNNDIRIIFVLTVLSKIEKTQKVRASRKQFMETGISASCITTTIARLEQLKVLKKHDRSLDSKNREFVEFELLF
jgi:hypothetical protein